MAGRQVAVDGVGAASARHVFFGTDDDGAAAIVETIGNENCHVILRGGRGGPNYDGASIAAAVTALDKAGLPGRVMIDASHANSGKDHVRQAAVARELATAIGAGERAISGIMLESFLVAGRHCC